jgi:uncharacterized membrane protein
MLEMIAVTFDGAHAAERQLSDLRDTRKDEWLSEVSLLEHDADGRYSVKAKNPSIDKSHAGKGAAMGGLTGLFIGAIGGPFGLLLWGSLGALTGSAMGVGHESAFKPMVDELKSRLAPDASMLVLVGESPALDSMQSAIDPPPNRVLRQALTSDQARELSEERTPAK